MQKKPKPKYERVLSILELLLKWKKYFCNALWKERTYLGEQHNAANSEESSFTSQVLTNVWHLYLMIDCFLHCVQLYGLVI